MTTARTEPTTSTPTGLGAEDAKLVSLARAARARTGASQGAAVRDGDGRTYAATDVALSTFRLSALRAALAQAVASGAAALEAAALVSDSPVPAADDLSALCELGGPGIPVHLAGPDGALLATRRSA